MATLPVTNHSRLRRAHRRGRHDRATIDAILDATPVCTIAHVVGGRPVATPTLHWREGDHVYWHGASASRMLKASEGCEVCLTVSIIDGYVLARSAYNHSVNYRSVMLFGTAFRVTDPDEKAARLRAFVDGLFPGRWDTLRPPTAQEMKATAVLGMRIDEGAAKIRSGPPADDAADLDLPIWAGIIPVRTETLAPEADPHTPAGIPMPAHVRDFRAG